MEIIENDPKTKDQDFIFELRDIKKYFEEIYYEKNMKN